MHALIVSLKYYNCVFNGKIKSLENELEEPKNHLKKKKKSVVIGSINC